MRAELLRFLHARLGNEAAADDVFQELFLKLRFAQLPEHVQNPRSFIYRTAFNLSNAHARSARRRVARDSQWSETTTQRVGGEAIADVAGAEDRLAAKEHLRVVLQAIEALPPKCKEVFINCRIEGRSHREVTERLGISAKTVEKHMTTALKHLALTLADVSRDWG